MSFRPRLPRLPGRGVGSVGGGGRPRRRLTLVAAAACIFLMQLDFYALNLALPSMAAEFGSSTTDLQWVISGYILAQAAFLIPGGKLGDILGRRRMLVVGLVIFGVGSLGAGLGSDPPIVIAFRVVQGMGSGIVYPLAFAVITEAFPGRQAKRAIGNAYGIGAVALAMGPLLGGGVTELISWRSVLLVNVPFCLVAIVAALAWLPESRDPTVSRRIDLAGLVVVVLGIVAITVAADRMNAWRPVVAAALAVGGLVLLAAFVLRERVAESPLVRLDLFRNAKFVVVTLMGMVAYVAFVVTIFATTIHLQQVRGYSPFVAGLAVLAASVGGGVADPFAGRLSQRVAVRRLIAAAILIGAVGLVVVAFGGQIGPYLLGLAVAGFGYQIGSTLTNLGTQAMVPAERAGEASGVTFTILSAGSGVAVAAAGTLIEQGDLAAGIMRVLLGVAASSAVATMLLARVPRFT
ncbi:MFS transporter [Salinispora tropica]|uniref:Major facilitator superfamily MFS_1 n=1 Tax=Salinispora tropica (strain ATCC BAA-916 / DSM 44818 / JCM 13857 / NBRC 105044 / CNB-440) TaxID=369723 RepID=A4X943_SALTO|nr:MFS transporter [Salinispora tropica]ABP55400.1 major facilitator superfamily MFS_1 [Salinispora tropica CNB-440]